jgi:putative (di)nucleoside polyphosphate hydrolase
MTPATSRGGADFGCPTIKVGQPGKIVLHATSWEGDMRDKPDWRDEPTLEELLSDPITWTVMKSDKVEEHELRSLLRRVAADLAAGSLRSPEGESSSLHDGMYRKGVGIMLLNARNEVFVGQRADTRHDAWQMPQGGIDAGEDPREAAFRELKEEIGTDKAHIVAESKDWLRYELPPDLRERWGERGRWLGQEQKWFVMSFQGSDADINIATEHPEFSAWKWIAIEQLPDLIVSFKRQLYVDVVREFSQFGGAAR